MTKSSFLFVVLFCVPAYTCVGVAVLDNAKERNVISRNGLNAFKAAWRDADVVTQITLIAFAENGDKMINWALGQLDEKTDLWTDPRIYMLESYEDLRSVAQKDPETAKSIVFSLALGLENGLIHKNWTLDGNGAPGEVVLAALDRLLEDRGNLEPKPAPKLEKRPKFTTPPSGWMGPR